MGIDHLHNKSLYIIKYTNNFEERIKKKAIGNRELWLNENGLEKFVSKSYLKGLFPMKPN